MQFCLLSVALSAACHPYLCGLEQDVWDMHATEELQRLPELCWRADMAQ